jgi:hypothetical protein
MPRTFFSSRLAVRFLLGRAAMTTKTVGLPLIALLSVSLAGLGACVLVACTTTGASASSLAADAAAADDAGDDAADDASTTPDDGTDAADGGPAAFGEPCTAGNDATCVAGLICLAGPSGGDVGFCTKTCPKTSAAACPGAPTGTAAFCVVTDANSSGDKGCAFVCRQGGKMFTCPGKLECQTTQEPAGSGQYLCLP